MERDFCVYIFYIAYMHIAHIEFILYVMKKAIFFYIDKTK